MTSTKGWASWRRLGGRLVCIAAGPASEVPADGNKQMNATKDKEKQGTSDSDSSRNPDLGLRLLTELPLA